MNIAVIFAGGYGKRMNSENLPKQFLELHGKPIIIYTLELFENHPDIDAICVACLETWINTLEALVVKYGLKKVVAIVPGGETGQDSIYNALSAAKRYIQAKNVDDACVLIHDGVRPLINATTISDNICMVEKMGNCITCIPSTETFIVKKDNGYDVPHRKDSIIVRAPQSFRLNEILDIHEQARRDGKHDFIDNCTMMYHYGHQINTVMGPFENIKITTPTDFYLFRAIVEMREHQNALGV